MPSHLGGRDLGQVDVEQRLIGEVGLAGDSSNQSDEEITVGCHRLRLIAGERDADAGHAERHGFHGSSDRSRVQDVLAHVGAVIYSGEDEVGALGHERLHREHDTVGRGSVDLPTAVRPPGGTKGPVQGE